MVKLKAFDIEEVLEGCSRQYLVGDLKKPQLLPFIRDTQLEIGITDYKEFTVEKPHVHDQTHEYQYMLQGETEYMNVDTGEVFRFSEGDFYYIPTHTPYAQKSKPGTRILCIKTPSLNDKKALEETEQVKQWYTLPF